MEVLSTESDVLIQLDLKEGKLPEAGLQTNQILIDEGLNHFLGWETGEIQTLMFGSTPAPVEIVGITQGEMARTVYFHRSDLANIVGVEATAVLIDLPEGEVADSDLGNVSLVVIAVSYTHLTMPTTPYV